MCAGSFSVESTCCAEQERMHQNRAIASNEMRIGTASQKFAGRRTANRQQVSSTGRIRASLLANLLRSFARGRRNEIGESKQAPILAWEEKGNSAWRSDGTENEYTGKVRMYR